MLAGETGRGVVAERGREKEIERGRQTDRYTRDKEAERDTREKGHTWHHALACQMQVVVYDSCEASEICIFCR